MSSTAIPRKQLFTASCLALLVTSLSFGIRAGILNSLGTNFTSMPPNWGPLPPQLSGVFRWLS